MFYERIKELRTARNLSQVQLAEALFVTKQSVSNWENNNICPSIDIIVRTAKFFSVTTDYILGLDDRKMLDISALSDEKAAHLAMIADDLRGD